MTDLDFIYANERSFLNRFGFNGCFELYGVQINGNIGFCFISRSGQHIQTNITKAAFEAWKKEVKECEE